MHTDAQPATTVRDRLKTAGDACRTLAADPRLADPAGHRDAVAQGIDDLVDAAADALAAASTFALPQAGFGDLYQWRAQVFTRRARRGDEACGRADRAARAASAN